MTEVLFINEVCAKMTILKFCSMVIVVCVKNAHVAILFMINIFFRLN